MSPMKAVQINEVGDIEHFGDETIPLALSEKKDKWIICSSCMRDTWHEVTDGMCKHIRTGGYESWDKFLIVKCKGCENLCFLKEYSLLMDDCTTDEDGRIIDGYEHKQSIYPITEKKSQLLGDIEMLPATVASIYKETCSVIQNEQYILGGAGLRAIVESICVEKNSKGPKLFHKINDLAKKGIIKETEAEYLHSLRFMGNKALHESVAHSTSEIRLALEIIEHMLRSVYIIPNKAKGLPSEKSQPI